MLTLNPHGRYSLVGRTGAGKTGFARAILLQMALAAEARQNKTYRIFILATKPIPAYKEQDFSAVAFEGTSYSEFALLEDMPRATGRVVVWKPSEASGQRTPEYYEAFFRQIFHYGKPAQVFVDELQELTQGLSGRRVPVFYKKIYAQGRGLDIGISSGIQDPVFIPREILSQADLLAVFRLQTVGDREKLAASFGRQFLIGVPDKHGVYIYDTLTSEIQYYSDWQRILDGLPESPMPTRR